MLNVAGDLLYALGGGGDNFLVCILGGVGKLKLLDDALGEAFEERSSVAAV